MIAKLMIIIQIKNSLQLKPKFDDHKVLTEFFYILSKIIFKQLFVISLWPED